MTVDTLSDEKLAGAFSRPFGFSPRTATEIVAPSLRDTTLRTAIATDESQNSLLARAKRSSLETPPHLPSLFGESSRTRAASRASTVQSSETKPKPSRQSLSDRLTPSLISAGLVRGITPSSVRTQSGQPMLDIAFSKQGGENAE